MSWMVRHRSWRMSYWICATVSGVVQLVGLPVCSSSSTDVRPVLNRVCHWNTCVRLKLCSPKPCWIILRVSVALFPRLAQNLMHTCSSFLWSIVKIATGHVHDSKQTRVKTAHVILPMWNLARWLAKHGSPTFYRCFVLLQLLYRWWHQYGKFWINPCIIKFPVRCVSNTERVQSVEWLAMYWITRIQFSAGAEIFLLEPSIHAYHGLFSWGKLAKAWSWPSPPPNTRV